MMNKFNTDVQCEEAYGTFKGEPASEDGWNDNGLTPAEEFDILFGYAEERHRNDPCARPAPKN